MQTWMSQCIKDTQANQAHGSYNRSNDAQPTQYFLGQTRISRETTLVTKEAFGQEREVEEDGRYDAAGDE